MNQYNERSLRARFFARPILLLGIVASLSTSGCEQITKLIRSISDGAACSSAGQCLGGVCLDEFPGGYCSTASCEEGGCSNIFGSECLQLPNGGTPLCYEACADEDICREGYRCFDIDTARVCLPASFDGTLTAAGALGSACSNAAACDSGLCLTNLVGGYCSTLDCGDDSACSGGRCMVLDEETAVTACFRGCTDDSACRFGYRCQDPDGVGGVCVPRPSEAQSPVRNPAGADDGQPCTVDINCKGGTCLRAAEGYPGGYCTTLDCATVGCNDPAGRTAQCRGITQQTACYLDCSDASQCRDGYNCVGGDVGEGFCAPPIAAPAPLPSTSDGVEVICDSTASGTTRTIEFHIAPDTTAFAVVPFSESQTVRPLRLQLPNGTVGADFRDDHAFFDINPFYIETAAPVFFPAAPQFASITQQGGGTYSLEIETRDANMCFFVLQKSSPGAELAVNIYFVGVPGLTATNAQTHSGFTQMMTVFTRIYSNAGIDIDQVRLFDVDAGTAERFAIIRDLNDLFRLTVAASDPGPTLQERLSIDVFLIGGFAVPQAPGLLGVSLGLPGVPAFHGSAGTALVFTAEYLGTNAGQTGQTMAHEIGHFNGLRHTSEHGGASGDPLEDTPQCSNPDRGAACPDANNLMFPFSLGTNQELVSPAQAQVLRASPHVR